MAPPSWSPTRSRDPPPRRQPMDAALSRAFATLQLPSDPHALHKRWLLEHGRDDEALAVVRKLHGTTPEAEQDAAREFAEMQVTIKAERTVLSRSLSDLWATRGSLRRTLVAVGVQVFGQFSGINGASSHPSISCSPFLGNAKAQSNVLPTHSDQLLWTVDVHRARTQSQPVTPRPRHLRRSRTDNELLVSGEYRLCMVFSIGRLLTLS